MKVETRGRIIAVREYFISGDLNEVKPRVLIGEPLPFPDSSGFYCPYQITGSGREEIKYAADIDAVQAIQGAMTLIGTDLEFLNRKLRGSLRWEADDQGGLGFGD